MTTDELMSLTACIPGRCACFKLRAAARRLTQSYEEALRPFDLKATQFSVMVAVYRTQGKVPITQLADYLQLDRTSLSRNLAALERRGLAARSTAGRQNARTVMLTPAGQTVLKDAIAGWLEAQAATRAQVGEEVWHLLQALPDELRGSG